MPGRALIRVAPDLCLQRHQIDEVIGLPAQIVCNHCGLRRHGQTTDTLRPLRCSASTSVVKSPSPENRTR